ncbi:MAG: hypothetical protein ACE5FW_02475 [Candidatus Aenigmatarchaeota archaeon]
MESGLAVYGTDCRDVLERYFLAMERNGCIKDVKSSHIATVEDARKLPGHIADYLEKNLPADIFSAEIVKTDTALKAARAMIKKYKVTVAVVGEAADRLEEIVTNSFPPGCNAREYARERIKEIAEENARRAMRN